MPSRMNSRATTTARNEVLDMLKQDHQQVKKAYRSFTRMDRAADPLRAEALVRQMLADLLLHATLEEELLYPAARLALSEPDLIDEAEVEHASTKALILQLNDMQADDPKFSASFTVLCEYVLHHVKEEEGEMFPQLQTARMDWEALADAMRARRADLAPADADVDEAEPANVDADADADAPTLRTSPPPAKRSARKTADAKVASSR